MTTAGLDVPELDLGGLGAPIRGPRALTDDWSRFWHLTYNIARNEFKLRFFGSMLGYVWQLMRPLLLFGVLLFVFSHVAKVSTAPHYAVALLAGIVLFTFFGEATGGAVRSVVDRENLVRKIHFPRLVIPLSIVLLASFNLALNLIVVLVFALAEGVRPMLTWVEAPLIIALLVLLLHRPGHAAVGAVRPLPRHSADLGGVHPGPLLRLRHPDPGRAAERTHERHRLPSAHAQSAGGHRRAVPPRDDRPERAVGRSGTRRLVAAARAARRSSWRCL